MPKPIWIDPCFVKKKPKQVMFGRLSIPQAIHMPPTYTVISYLLPDFFSNFTPTQARMQLRLHNLKTLLVLDIEEVARSRPVRFVE
jgi:hypothetical protein